VCPKFEAQSPKVGRRLDGEKDKNNMKQLQIKACFTSLTSLTI
jgi:hypothetical protein